MVHKVRMGGTTSTAYSFPSARAMDVANGYLWLAGKFYIEKRNLIDTSLIARFDLSEYFTSNGGNHWIQGIVVSETRIYLMASFERMLVLSLDGVVLEEKRSYAGLGDMMIVNGRLWGVSSSSTIHEIDPTTLQSIHTYYLAGNIITCRFHGIANRNGKIACADYVQNYLRVFEVALPSTAIPEPSPRMLQLTRCDCEWATVPDFCDTLGNNVADFEFRLSRIRMLSDNNEENCVVD